MYAITINKEVMDLRKQGEYMEALGGRKVRGERFQASQGRLDMSSKSLTTSSKYLVLSCLGSLTGSAWCLV